MIPFYFTPLPTFFLFPLGNKAGLFSNSTCHPMLYSSLFVDSIKETYNYDQVDPPIKKVLPSSLRGSCNIVVPIVDSLRGTDGTAIAASFSSPSHPFFLDIIEETYNLEPLISIYLKN